MYSTIVTNHPTVIRHANPQPKGIGVNPDTAKAFALSGEATELAENMKKGIYSVPVRLESDANGQDNLEAPNFIESKENLRNKIENQFTLKEKDPQKFLADSFSKDADLLLHNLENKRDKAERISVRKNTIILFFSLNFPYNLLYYLIFSYGRKEKISKRC